MCCCDAEKKKSSDASEQAANAHQYAAACLTPEPSAAAVAGSKVTSTGSNCLHGESSLRTDTATAPLQHTNRRTDGRTTATSRGAPCSWPLGLPRVEADGEQRTAGGGRGVPAALPPSPGGQTHDADGRQVA